MTGRRVIVAGGASALAATIASHATQLGGQVGLLLDDSRSSRLLEPTGIEFHRYDASTSLALGRCARTTAETMEGVEALIFVEDPLPVAGLLAGTEPSTAPALEGGIENVIGLVSALSKWLDSEVLRDIVFVLRTPDMFSQIVLADYEPYASATTRFARKMIEDAADSPSLRVSILEIAAVDQYFDGETDETARRVAELLSDLPEPLYVPKFFKLD